MMHLTTRRIRSLATACTVALVSLGTSACMTGRAAMSPAMMQQMQGMHHFAMAVHMGEIEEAQLALANASNPQVRQFAQRMVAEHTPAMQREMQMMAQMGGTAAMGMNMDMNMDMTRMRAMLMESPHSRPVMESHMQAMQMLRGMTGMAFDRAYMNRQVSMHSYALQNMDRMMATMGHGNMAGGAMASGSMAGRDANMGAHAGMDMNANMAMNAKMSPMEWHMMQRNMVAMHLQMAQQMMASMR